MWVAGSIFTSALVWLLPTAHADELKLVSSQVKMPESYSFSGSLTPDLSLARPDQLGLTNLFSAKSDTDAQNRQDHWSSKQRQLHLQSDFSVGTSETGHGLIISPRFSEFKTNDAGLESYSAEIRLGNVVQFERGRDTSGWYIFAAADGEALSISTRSLSAIDGNPMSVSLDDQITIGDLQAGLSTYKWGTQFTVSYIETEASFSAPGGLSNSKKESFAGVSLAKSF